MLQVPTEGLTGRFCRDGGGGGSGLGFGQGGKKIALQGGDGMEAHLPNPPLPLLGRRARRGVWAGAALPAVPGGRGGSDPNIHGSK